MAKPLNLDDYEEVKAPASKPLDLSQFEEVTAAPAGQPGPWRSGAVAPPPDFAPDVQTLGPTPATVAQSNPEADIAEAKRNVEEKGGFLSHVGRAVSNIGATFAGIPGEIMDNPEAAPRSLATGAASASTLGAARDLHGPALERMRAKAEAGSLDASDLQTLSMWQDAVEPDRQRTPITDPLAVIDQLRGVHQATQDETAAQPGLQMAGGILAPSPDKIVAGALAKSLPVVAGAAGRVARTGTIGAGAGAVGGAGHALASGATPAEALEETAAGAGAGYVGAAGVDLPIEAASAATRALARNAAGRIADRRFTDLGTGATPPEQTALIRQRPEVMAALREHQLEPVVTDAGKLLPQAKAARGAVGSKLDSAFAAAERPTNAEELIDQLSARRDQLAGNPATKVQADKLTKFIDHVRERWAKPAEQALPEPAPPPRLSDREALADFASRATKVARNEAGARADDVTEAMRKFDLRQHVADPRAMKAAVDPALTQVGKQIGNVDKVVTEASGGMPISDVMGGLHRVVEKYRADPATRGLAANIGKVVEDVRDAWKDRFPVVNQTTRVPLADVRRLSSQLGESAFAGDATLPPKLASKLRRELYGAVRDELNGHIDRTLQSKPEIQAAVGDYQQLNRDYGALRVMKKLTDPQAVAAELPPPAAPMTVAERRQPPPVPKSGQVPLRALRGMAEALKKGSPEREIIEQAIATRVNEAPEDVASAIAGLSRRDQALEAIETAAARREPKEAFQGTSRFSKLMSQVADKGVTLTGLGMAAGKAALTPLTQKADQALARLALSAHGKRVTPAIIATAIADGVPRDVVLDVLNRAGVKDVPLPEEPAEGDRVAGY